MIDHILNQDAEIITTTTDRHGDQIEQSSTSVKCRFRYSTIMEKNLQREGLDSTDATIWLSPDTEVSEGTIIKVDGVYWRVDRLIKARKMDADIQFYKAFVNRHSL